MYSTDANMHVCLSYKSVYRATAKIENRKQIKVLFTKQHLPFFSFSGFSCKQN